MWLNFILINSCNWYSITPVCEWIIDCNIDYILKKIYKK